MQITRHLPHFNEPTLLVVSGKQGATLFLAHGDQVWQAQSIRVQAQGGNRFSRFEKRAGQVQEFDMEYRDGDADAVRNLHKQVAEAVTRIDHEHHVTTLYLFCPTHLANHLEEALGHELRAKVQFIFFGNYTHQHPFVLLSKILENMRQETGAARVEDIPPDALDILKKTGLDMA